MKKLVVIDADSLIFRIAYKFNEQEFAEEDLWMVENQATIQLKEILVKSSADEFIGLMTDGESTFRHNLALTNPYKGNRGEKPKWYTDWSPHIKSFLKEKYGFIFTTGIEVDDALGIINTMYQDNEEFEIILASIDKDMLQIPAKHYNYAKDSWLLVTIDQSEENLWRQVLQGDPTDSIVGLPGIGEKKALKILEGHSIDKYPFIVLSAYIKYFGSRTGILKFAETCNLVTLLTKGTIVFEPVLNPFNKTVEQELNEDIDNAFN